MTEPIFKITVEAHGDVDDEKPGAQPGVVFDADFMGIDILRFKKAVPLGQTLKLFRSMVGTGKKVLGL